MHNVNNGLDTTKSSQSLMTYVLFAESDRNENKKRKVSEREKKRPGGGIKDVYLASGDL